MYESVCVNVCGSERDREREKVCVCVCMFKINLLDPSPPSPNLNCGLPFVEQSGWAVACSQLHEREGAIMAKAISFAPPPYLAL